MKTSISETAKLLGFNQHHYVKGRFSIADLFKPRNRCGIYLLHFSNNEFYVGQAVDVTRRFVQHTKTHDDIESISFQRVAKNKLNQTERELIYALESKGFPLRNIALTSIPASGSDFELVMPLADQEKWVSDPNFSFVDGTRPTNEGLRQKYRRKFQQFLNKPHAKETITATTHYIQRCIPAVKKSEISFWSCTCLPATKSNTQIEVLIRINMFWQEVFVAYLDENGRLRFEVQVAKEPLMGGRDKLHWKLNLQFPTVSFLEHFYDSGGRDQMRLGVNDEKTIDRLTQNTLVLQAMRTLNLRLANKGPCNSSRNHCLDLADRLFEV